MQGLCNITYRVSFKDIILKSMSQPLSTILITRPLGQHEAFAERCLALGLQVVHLPCLAIEPLGSNELTVEMVDQADSVLFTSKNAVLHAHLNRPLPWPDTIVNAIGPATCAALAALNQPVQLTPLSPFTSESYLQQLQSLPPQKLLIIKGSGGRTVIADQLGELGWKVSAIDVYRRTLPAIGPEQVTELFHNAAPDLISITSNEALQNLHTLTRSHWDTLRTLPLIVNSQRCAVLAKSMGFEQSVLLATSAGDEGQIEQVKRWISTLQPTTK